jgi:branched-chain amino acid transport system permease protein
MAQFLSGYEMYTFSSIVVFIALATLLHLQFGVTGIVNFGVVGFFGLGMYIFGVFLVQYHIPYILAMLMATGLTGLVALGLGAIILDLDNQSILVATLAIATVVKDLATTEKWLTKGVIGLGTVPFPLDLGLYSQVGYFLLALVLTALIVLYAYKLESSPYGRLLFSIRDNEPLARSLGKSTSRQKLIFFAITSALMGLFGTLHASNVHFLVPRMLDPGVTFTVWIALILGGRKRILGGLIGTLATIGLFDFVITTFVPIPASAQSQLLPVIKMWVYGLTLMLILMYRPSGILGEKKIVKK